MNHKLHFGALLKKYLLCLALCNVFFSQVWAIGLGDIKVHSALNQPFLAEIPLLNIEQVPRSAIQVAVADPKAFERVGLVRGPVLSQLRFKIVLNAEGKAHVLITSKARITDPYLQFLLDVTWPQGEFYRTYTILLDPPPSAPISNSTGYSGRLQANLSEYHYRPTQSGDVLWTIASKVRPENTTVSQTALAILGRNPEAFIDNNSNGLKQGYTLKIPSKEVIDSIPFEEAAQELQKQRLAWQEHRPIEHVLSPPYYGDLKLNPASQQKARASAHNDSQSYIPSVKLPPSPARPQLAETSTFTHQEHLQDVSAAAPVIVKALTDPIPQQIEPIQLVLPQNTEETTLKVKPKKHTSLHTNANEWTMVLSAIDAIKASNATLKEEVQSLTQQNISLQNKIFREQTHSRSFLDLPLLLVLFVGVEVLILYAVSQGFFKRREKD